MTFDTSPIRAAHNFRLTFIQLLHTSQITRMQLIFLCYLIERGNTQDFLCSKAKPSGMTWGGTNQYLNKLKQIGYASKQGRLWTVTDKGQGYYATFMKEFNSNGRGAFCWR